MPQMAKSKSSIYKAQCFYQVLNYICGMLRFW